MYTHFMQNKVQDHVHAKTAFTQPANYLALSTTTPTEAGANFTEPTGGSYARKQILGADWNAAVNGDHDNANLLQFVQATASWGTVTHWGIFDALTVGNLLEWAALTVAKAIDNGDTAEFAVGDLDSNLNGV